ncbi:ABC transporter permease [Oceanobacillus neutriphilus]|uniref:ABC transporter permease YclI n=1 Tax=Oceanobacillus neutriphilus TaxID=531815 RepID=A0ABQ2NQI5_9BACI|nr:ABC transporter permease [Oceanobacillus neutriphilus]GGP08115.1 putative ABC transporter permease YclI [Oceanobacillus neutriphilus]
MNFIKRGFLGITRKKGKSLILLAVIFILGNLISGAISIQQATGNVESTVKERLGTAATIDIDYDEWDAMSDSEMESLEMEEISVDLIKEIGELSYVKYYDYNMTFWLGSESIERYQDEDLDDEMEEDMMFGPSMDFTLKGINYAPVIDFEEQKGKLVDGRVFTQEEVDGGSSVAVISKKLAEENNLNVGDTFTLANDVYTYDYNTGEGDLVTSRDVVLEVIGLFEPQEAKKETEENSESDMMVLMEDTEYYNTMYVPNEVVIDETKYNWEESLKADEELAEMMEEEEESFEYYSPIYYLNNQEDIEAFTEEVKPLLPELYTVISASDQYDNIAGPIESMSKLAKYVLIVAVIATVLITGLVVLLFLRDRKRELGIYLSLGEKRSRVVGQILIEVMVVAVVGITLSLFSGNLLAQQVSDTLMRADDNNEEYFEEYYYEGISTDLTADDVMDSYEVTLNSSYVLGFYGVGLVTILISTIIPLIYIVRLNPKKILM